MKRTIGLISLIITIAATLPMAAWVFPAQPVIAAACPTGTSGVPAVDGVQPPSIQNNLTNTITVTGANFEDGAVVILDGYGALGTTCLTPTVLTATVPAGIPGSQSGRDYPVIVVNPNTNESNDDVTLKVFAVAAAAVTPTPTATPQPTAFARPILTVQSYGASSRELTPGENIDFEMTLQNLGQIQATNVMVTFEAGDLIPRVTGGVQALGDIWPGGSHRFFQPFTVSRSVSGQIASLKVTAQYNDVYGAAYSETFNLTFPLVQRASGPAAPTPTPTPRPGLRPQIVIEGYAVDVERLQPGTIFEITLNARNLGAYAAKGVNMIVGGGTVSDGGSGTPSPGGISGGSSDLTNFAPFGSSNVQFLGDVSANGALTATQRLVVNVSTQPGAYPFKVSFTYTDETGQRYVDEQVVTLLVYSLPQLDVNFYRDPNPIFAGQPSPLPVQVTNLGREAAVLGNMEVTSTDGEVVNNIILVGRLEPGGYFTMDPMLMPYQPGPLTVTVRINYNDNFNQPQIIERTLTVDVLEMAVEPIPDGSEGSPGEPQPAPAETLLQKIWRFIRGLLGLDSAPPAGGSEGMPQEGFPQEGVPVEPIPMPVPGKG